MKNIPVKGFVVHSDNGDGEHSHRLYITSWNGRQVHVHPFAGTTSFDDGHVHQYAGTTEPAPTGVQHTHGYYVETSFNHGHTHVIRGVTGPSVPLAGGGHIHYFEGVTTVNGRTPHTHHYRGHTGNESGR
ncbi:YmaF family protein [Paenibacillus thermotolerans]|uniref:YmaF family protein n=1 Tax=Paenibacillus thermotolerans TaxID=3027807 RepID=UPI002367B005|nr:MULTISPECIES: YmaF family protein [unclassified Paenibacillus]